ncbi:MULTISPECIES: GNAT family N-acetyltransferase [unclassified Streptomyces]|uniref:GNAT family N-acetyltransferase n=1 Tax=unclassified Streptomyces TaxID=2593676 RepID=UPI000DC761EF|nr:MULTISPECIES: GNAT family N-acetyltransferase [unclassified Streptomyces]AWZ07325.1 GNAT family N-acetyltransferase [Streptomyces sp. ICC4]AWZ13783.1 GNAT family N-acetyltransferase [Streptomyces sp. ICC1]
MIRTAQPADLDAIAALHTRARATYYRGRIPEEAYGGAAELARTREGWSLAVARAGADGGVLCAERDGELTGVAAFRTAAGETTLTQLHVDPAHWRRGTGAALHAACLDAWHRAGVRRVRLEVYGHNLRAQAFYATHGWLADPAGAQAGSHLTLWLTVPAAGDAGGRRGPLSGE